MNNLVVVNHPLAQHLLTQLRDKQTPPAVFRSLTRKLTTILLIEATRDLPTDSVSVETPLERTQGAVLAAKLVVVPILRAGLGMLEPVVDLFPDVAVGYIGMERDHTTAIANSYYLKLPPVEGRTVLLIDPMLATGGSVDQALAAIRSRGAGRMIVICIVAAPEGVERITQHHPDVPIYTAALDRELNPAKYILPGIGDFGDRLYGTLTSPDASATIGAPLND
ncbi:MAG: uracil phosphoribosyltransferase [Armatimonadota bacterium]|nr:uracil phosphoribosyltransferase [bacterium]MCS7308760.1 uracil phosphoribosyltransferase [Armatimonadota bacterium]MDW8103514.1 uracil phosphoribosyltransferase [Armatimonadota bacterium]MDW8289306.1 uracil phosphoribosyltransferase [Armatimonadota bacterium]